MQSEILPLLTPTKRTLVILLSFFLCWNSSFAEESSGEQKYLRSAVFIGVLAHRGIEGAYRQWTATAKYLTENIDGHKFYIVPLDLNSISTALEEKRIDFLLTNPSSYSTLEIQFGITRIATLKKLQANHILSKFGSVIFSRADRKDINGINDLRGKSFMAVHEAAFGGWLMALKVFRSFGIKPQDDFSKLEFNGFPQDDIVLAVNEGVIDAGTVRTGILERMVLDGKVKMSDFRILNQQHNPNFPLVHSTDLFPEWALATTSETSEVLAQKVSLALLVLPADSEIAKMANSAGWTVPMDYQPVRALMEELQVGPYKHTVVIHLKDVVKKYQLWISIVAILVFVLFAIVLIVFRLNNNIKQSKKFLEQEIIDRKQAELDSRLVARRIAAIYEVAAMPGNIDYQYQIREILKVGCEFLAVEFGRVCSTNIAENINTVVQVIAPDVSPLKPGFVVPLEKTYCAHVIKRNKMIVIDDATNSEWNTAEAYDFSGFESYIATPIYVNDELFGTINFSSNQVREQAFSKADQNFVELMAKFTSTALERQVTEEKMNEVKTQAILANNAKSEFLANMSHEIRTPMNAILGYAQILTRDENITASQRHAINTICKSGKHLLELINEILDISKIESGRMVLSESNFNITSTLHELAAMFSYRCDEKNITWREEFEVADEDVFVVADQVKIRQILVNLIGNAVKFTQEGSVTLKFSQQADYMYVFDIIDTGLGVKDSERESIFEPFRQSKSGVSQGGTGLGLAIAKKHVELMGGELCLLSSNERGAHFRVTVQFKPGKIEHGVVAKIVDYQDHKLTVVGNLSILVVDDVKENRELLYEQLSHYGFSVWVAFDGKDAVEKVKESKPDMILMDYRMPVLNGIEATKIIKEIYGSDVKVAMVSASVYAHETEIFNGCGADFILNKPVLFSELETMLSEAFPDKITIEKREKKVTINAASFDNLKNIPVHYLTEIEELADIGLVTELDLKIEELREVHEDLADYLHSLSTTMKLNELSTIARKILDHG